ncbi:hypothetical protein FISHEDRAFT_59408 [Fistulina hepatica ATCC 64428]|uniref:Uncharacterized protein n=1 Tax=Fistulina hepatica ATCC 64428 TaxID=1128425 RepID=A0A0D7AAY0_9AGAR|nr:hypothetical protein FISHEDRAFT_59408 [Fistulina hepatica ATCC 64428]
MNGLCEIEPCGSWALSLMRDVEPSSSATSSHGLQQTRRSQNHRAMSKILRGRSLGHDAAPSGFPAPVSSTDLNPSTSLMKRVSSVFSPIQRKQRPSQHESNNDRPALFYDSDESVSSIDDIRRPSGLGRSTSLSCERSIRRSSSYHEDNILPASATGTPMRVTSPTGIIRSLTRGMGRPFRGSVHMRDLQVPESHAISFDVPTEVIVAILAWLPRSHVATIARVSRGFAAAARMVLYRRIDTRDVSQAAAAHLCATLAWSRHLTALVEVFTCYTWPLSPPTQFTESFASSDLSDLTIALQHMPNLVALTLPAFDFKLLRRHSAFGLRRLVFLNEMLLDEDREDLFSWLDGQTNITSLSFPRLYNNHIASDDSDSTMPATDSSTPVAATFTLPSPDLLSPSSTLFFPTSAVSTPMSSTFTIYSSTRHIGKSLTLLPGLTSLRAPPYLISLLVPNRPVKHVIFNVDATLYTGLRPAALLVPLQNSSDPVTSLGLYFSARVDRRSIEKMLSVTATTLDGSVMLEELDIEISSAEPSARTALYKSVAAVLSRHGRMRELTLRGAKRENASVKRPELTQQELEMIENWRKLCPSLRKVQLTSCAVWTSGTTRTNSSEYHVSSNPDSAQQDVVAFSPSESSVGLQSVPPDDLSTPSTSPVPPPAPTRSPKSLLSPFSGASSSHSLSHSSPDASQTSVSLPRSPTTSASQSPPATFISNVRGVEFSYRTPVPLRSPQRLYRQGVQSMYNANKNDDSVDDDERRYNQQRYDPNGPGRIKLSDLMPETRAFIPPSVQLPRRFRRFSSEASSLGRPLYLNGRSPYMASVRSSKALPDPPLSPGASSRSPPYMESICDSVAFSDVPSSVAAFEDVSEGSDNLPRLAVQADGGEAHLAAHVRPPALRPMRSQALSVQSGTSARSRTSSLWSLRAPNFPLPPSRPNPSPSPGATTATAPKLGHKLSLNALQQAFTERLSRRTSASASSILSRRASSQALLRTAPPSPALSEKSASQSVRPGTSAGWRYGVGIPVGIPDSMELL